MNIKNLFIALIVTMFCFASMAIAEVSNAEFQKLMGAYLKTSDGQAAVGSAVEQHFRKKQQEAQKQQAARQKAELEEQFQNPVKVDLSGSPIRGSKDAPVTIVEFSDFQCPYCQRGHHTMEKVLKEYEGKVRLVFKNLPLDFHKEADPAARAALAAGKQGKFWEMHDALFENQSKLGSNFYTATAKKLGLDTAKFAKDMESEEVKAQVKKDVEIAKKHNFTGTPGFLVNGVAVKGAYPFDHFKEIIDRWLNNDSSKKS